MIPVVLIMAGIKRKSSIGVLVLRNVGGTISAGKTTTTHTCPATPKTDVHVSGKRNMTGRAK